MSQENVEAFNRGVDAYKRRDPDALLANLAPEVEWHPALLVSLGGQATVYRGHEGVRELLRDTDETLAEIHVEFSDVRDLGDQIVAIGRLRTRGKASGALAEANIGYIADFHDGKAIRIRTYLDPGKPSKPPGCGNRPVTSAAWPKSPIPGAPLAGSPPPG